MSKTAVSLLSVLVLLSVTCGDGAKQAGIVHSADLLPDTVAEGRLARSSEVSVFTDSTLWEYIDGGAELFLSYNFQEVATAEYGDDNTAIVVEIFRFDNATDAYGLYSLARPDSPNLVSLGVEGIVSTANLQFVKGEFLVALTGYDESEETARALMQAAQEIEPRVPGTTLPPEAFSLFPADSTVVAGDQYFVQSFLGREFLAGIYTRRFFLAGDTVMLFVSGTMSGDALSRWQARLDEMGLRDSTSGTFVFENGTAFGTDDGSGGAVIGGLRGGRVVGMVGYSEPHREFLSLWLSTLP
ncbi:MAG TPA: DUF6599 family protein [Acidobacteriota bacterium]|nr:DUF6599 family protein [Acidobacteriota bacterium]